MTAIILVLLSVMAQAYGEPQMMDVAYLKDGTMLLGLVVEQEAGSFLRLATPDQVVWTLEESEIDSIEKIETEEPLAVSYTDAALLMDGVVFRGTIVEQRPGESIVLRTGNGALLHIPMGDIWKLAKQKQVAGAPPKLPASVDAETEPMKIRLQIELAGRKLEELAGGGGEGRKEDAGTLRQDLQALERERDRADLASVDERRAVERREIEAVDHEVGQLVGELVEGLERCEQSQASLAIRRVSLATNAGMEEMTGVELASRLKTKVGEVAHRTIEKLPTDAEISARKTEAERVLALQGLLSSGKWTTVVGRIWAGSLAEKLPLEERQWLYESHMRRDRISGAALNAFPLLMLGSWAQGDWGAALLVYLGNLALGIWYGVQPNLSPNLSVVETPWGFATLWEDPAGFLFWVPLLTDAAIYAFGIWKPVLYADCRNKRLADMLGVDFKQTQGKGQAKVSFDPPGIALSPDGRGGLRLGVNLLSARY